LNPVDPKSYTQAWRELGGNDSFTLNAEAQARIDQLHAEQRMGAEEYRRLHPEIQQERYWNALTGREEVRGVPQRVLNRWAQLVDTFVQTTPQYKPSEESKKAMLAYLNSRNLDLSLTNLQVAFEALVAAGEIETQDTPETVARRAGSNATVLTDLGGSPSGFPQYHTEGSKWQFRQMVKNLSADELREKMKNPAFRKALDEME
jgi:hypothetical protein